MKVMVVDSATLFREGLVNLLSTRPDIEIVAEVGDSWEAVVKARGAVPDLVLLDPDVPTGNGLESMQQIRQESPLTKCIVLSDSVRQGDLLRAFVCGAQGYLLKDIPPEELFKAIRDVMEGKTALSFSLAGELVHEFLEREAEEEDPAGELTARERQVLELLGEGVSSRDMAGQLNLSASTVRHHIHSIVGKLGLKNRVGAAVYARRRKVESLKKGKGSRVSGRTGERRYSS